MMKLTERDPEKLFENSPAKAGVVGSEAQDGEREGGRARKDDEETKRDGQGGDVGLDRKRRERQCQLQLGGAGRGRRDEARIGSELTESSVGMKRP